MSIQKRASWTALFLIFVVSIAGAVATWWQDRDVMRMIDGHLLESVQSIQGFAESSRQRELELKSAILASNPGFVGYVSHAMSAGAESGGVVDAASIRDLLEERRSQFNFDVAAILDPSGRTIVMLGESLRSQQDFSATPLMAAVRASSTPSIGLLGNKGRLVLVSLTPMLRGDTVEALLLTGLDIGDGFIAPLASAGHVDLAVIEISKSGMTVVASTLGSEDHQAIVDAVDAEPVLVAGSNDSAQARPFDLKLVGGGTRASITPLFASPSTGLLVSIVPLAQRVVSTSAIRKPMLVAGASVLIILLVLWWLIQRVLVRPVNNLVEMSDRVLRGDIQVVARDVGTGDISMIAAAFNQALAGLRGYKEVIEKREGKKSD